MKTNRFAAVMAVFLCIAGTGALASEAGHDDHDKEKGHASSGKEAKGHSGDGGGKEAEGHEGHEEGEEGEEGSDLDRSIKELWAAQCEHKMLHYKCDECRYELGVVKVPASVLSGEGKPGLVDVTVPKRISFGSSKSYPGEVALSEGKTFHASAPQAGVIRAVFVDVGAVVKQGDPLFEIDSHDLAEAKGDLKKKAAARDLARKNAEREARLFEKKISAEVEVQEAQARLADAEIDLSNARSRLMRLGVPESELASLDGKSSDPLGGLLTVRAAQGGTVLERHVAVGERVEPDKELLLLSDLTEVWAWATLREDDARMLSRIGKNAPIPAEVRASGGKVYRGHFDIVSGVMNEQTRTLKGRVVVSNPDGGLRPGMFVTIRILLPGGGSGIAVPKGAVLTDAGRSFVFVHKEGEYWVRRPVKTGRASGDVIEISKGISPGQKVVANGAFLLKSDVLRSKMGAGCAD